MVLKDVRAQGTLISVHFLTKPSKWRQFYARGSKSNNFHKLKYFNVLLERLYNSGNFLSIVMKKKILNSREGCPPMITFFIANIFSHSEKIFYVQTTEI